MIAALLGVIGEEAPSSISGSDQMRAALVLGACLVAVALIAVLAIRQARRRQRGDRSGQGSGPAVHRGPGSDGGLKPDQNGSPSPRSGR